MIPILTIREHLDVHIFRAALECLAAVVAEDMPQQAESGMISSDRILQRIEMLQAVLDYECATKYHDTADAAVAESK